MSLEAIYRVHRAVAKEITPEELTPNTGDEDEKGEEKTPKEVERTAQQARSCETS